MMLRTAVPALLGLTALVLGPSGAAGAQLANAISVAGDSISRAFDANTSLYNHGASFCSAGADGTFSNAERLECAKGGDITNFNDARSGAKMRSDFADQSATMRTNLTASSTPRYAAVFMGHNDACTNTTSKT